MQTVGQILRAKGGDVFSVGPETPVYDALRLMAEKNCGAVLVLDGDRVAGILSERDYARKVALEGKSSRDTPVREIMTRSVVYVRPDQSVQACLALFTGKRIRHLPVLEEARLVGVISIGDVVKAIISDQEFVIHELENYIRGS